MRSVATGLLRNVALRGDLRRQFIGEAWLLAKRFSSPAIAVRPRAAITGLDGVVTQGYVDDPNRAIVAAICALTRAERFFEIGAFLGKTTWTVARTNPEIQITTLDLPDERARESLELEFTDPYLFQQWNRGAAFLGTPEQARIQQVYGDSATFDFSPFARSIDVVYIDGSHSYSYVKNDTEAALRMLRPNGTILWDDYPHYPGIYQYLNELNARLGGRLFLVEGTRLVVYSRHPALQPQNG